MAKKANKTEAVIDEFDAEVRQTIEGLGLTCLTDESSCIEQLIHANKIEHSADGELGSVTPALYDVNDILRQHCGACIFYDAEGECCCNPNCKGKQVEWVDDGCGHWLLSPTFQRTALKAIERVTAAFYMLLWAHEDKKQNQG